MPEIDGYVVQRLIARGRSGKVFEAYETSLRRTVAIKLLSDSSDPELVRRFEEEAKAIASLEHPNIARLFSYARTPEGQVFLAMEYARGGTLADAIQNRIRAPQLAARLMVTLADAVQCAHEAGIIHRDLKPGNILIASPKSGSSTGSDLKLTADEAQTLASAENPLWTGQSDGSPAAISDADVAPSDLRIADFGLARHLASDVRLTQTGQIMGTPAYMAPEQASGVTVRVGPAADIYSLGAVLYEMLAGRPPFLGTDAIETVLRVLSEDPVAPSELQPGIPKDLETICLKCLQKSVQRRYSSARELREDLERFLNRQPILARPASFAERCQKWVHRNPWPAAATSLMAVLLIGSVVALLFIQNAYSVAAGANSRLKAAIAETDTALDLTQESLDRIVVRVRDDLYNVPNATPVMLATNRDAADLYEKLHKLRPMDVEVAEDLMNAKESLGLAEWLFGSRESSEKVYRDLEAFVDEQVRRHPKELSFQTMQTKLLLEKVSATDSGDPRRSELQSKLSQQLTTLLQTHAENAEVLKLAVLWSQQRMTEASGASDWKRLIDAGRERVAFATRYRDVAAPEERSDAAFWLIRSQLALGNAFLLCKDPGEARAAFVAASDELSSLKTEPTNRDARNARGDVLRGLAKASLAQDDKPQARTHLHDAADVLQTLLAEYPDDWMVRESLAAAMVDSAELTESDDAPDRSEETLNRIQEHLTVLKASPAGPERFARLGQRLKDLQRRAGLLPDDTKESAQ